MAITVLKEWKDLVSSQFRYPGHVKMQLYIMSDVSKLDITATASNVFNLTNVQSTIDGYDDTYDSVATFEGTWRADGSMYLLSSEPKENLELPLWSSSPGEGFELEYEFEHLTSFVGITTSWDVEFQSWPTHVVVEGYSSDGSLVYSYEVSDIDSPFKLLDTPMDNVKKVRIEVDSWSSKSLRCRMSEIYFGAIVELDNRQVMSISETSKIDLMCSQLPTDTHKYTIKNQIYRMLPVSAASVSASSTLPLTDVARIFSASPATEYIASAEVNYWSADGTMYLPSTDLSENLDMPWISEYPDDPVDITITYDSPVQLNQIKITWDNVKNTWPTVASVEGYNSYDEPVFRKNCGDQGVISTISDIYSTVKYVIVHIEMWSKPGQRFRINQFESMLVYGNNNIPSEVNNLFDPTLVIGYSKYLAQRQKIVVQYGLEDADGKTLWSPKQTRFLNKWDVPTDAIQVDFESTTRLAFLTSTYSRGIYVSQGATFYDLALDILANSNIMKDTSDPEPWILPDSLKDYSTTAPLPKQAENSLLQLIAGATAHYLDTDPETGYVRFSNSLDDTRYTIDGSSQLQTPSVSIDTELRSIAIYLYSYTVDAEVVELFNDSVEIEGTKTVVITYKDNTLATECSAEIEGATLLQEEYFSYSAKLKLQVASGSGTVSIKLTGKRVSYSSVLVETYRDDLVISGKDIVIDNSLITNMNTLNAVANAALQYYSRRITVSTKYLGYPDVKAGDRIALYSQYMNENGHISENTFGFNGGFSGSIKTIMEV